MKKIPSLFMRDYEGTRKVYDEVVPGSEWVMNGEGVATRKFDGTSCMVKDGKLYKRFDAKKGRKIPEGAIPCEDGPNEHTGHWPHWVPVTDSNEDRWHREALSLGEFPDGTYELCGPKVNKNRDKFPKHCLIPHGSVELLGCPRDFEGIKEYLANNDFMEGIVWHHPDGRMVKIKRKDFGLMW